MTNLQAAQYFSAMPPEAAAEVYLINLDTQTAELLDLVILDAATISEGETGEGELGPWDDGTAREAVGKASVLFQC